MTALEKTLKKEMEKALTRTFSTLTKSELIAILVSSVIDKVEFKFERAEPLEGSKK